ncbi:MAG: proprotein convertase P-domain-containing protein, partial [Aureispira sp.]
MRIVYNYFFLFVLLALAQTTIAQSPDCNGAAFSPFCDSVNQYAATTSGNNAPFGNNYGCLGSTPDPTFFTLSVSQTGSINISLQSTANVDIDYILWGPYPNLATAINNCGNLGNGPAGSGNVVDTCSYDPASVEFVTVSNAQAGSVYILMVTNFSGLATNIFSSSNAGSGTIACPCDLPYALDTLPFPANNGGRLVDTTGGIGRYVVCPGEQLGIQVTSASPNFTDTLDLYAPYTTIDTAFPGAAVFTVPGLPNDTISLGAIINPTQAQIGNYRFDLAFEVNTPTNTCQERIPIEVIVPGINVNDSTVCSGSSIVLDVDSFPSTVAGFGQYQWTQIGGVTGTISNDTIARPTITAPLLPATTAFDSMLFQVQFNYGGCSSIDTVKIIVIGIPDGSFSYSDPVYCQQSAANPIANITGTPGGTFTSSTGVLFVNSNTGEIDVANTPTGNHTITYSLSSPGGLCNAQSSVNLEIIGITNFNATADRFFICDNELDTIQLNVNVSYGGTAPNNPTYSWTPTAPLNDPTIANPIAVQLTPDTFIVVYNDGVCLPQSDTVQIAAPYPVAVTTSPDVSLCSATSTQLGASVSSISGGQLASIPAPVAIQRQDTTRITLNLSGVAPNIITPVLLSSLEVCFDISMNTLNDITAFLVAPSGERVVLTQNNGGFNTALVGATFSNAAGNTPITGISFFPPIPSNVSYFPQAGANGFNSLLGATANGTWTLVIVHNSISPAGANGILNNWCMNFQDLSSTTFNWSPNTNISCTQCDSPFVTPASSTVYTVIAQNAFGCSDTGSVAVNVGAAVLANIVPSGSTILCAGDSVDLDAGAGFASYIWSTGSTAQVIRVGATNSYSVTVDDGAGCVDSDTIAVTVGTPLLVNLDIDSLSCNGTAANDGRIVATATGSFGGYTYSWSPVASTSDTLNNLGTGTYCVTVTDGQGCIADACGIVAEPSAVSVTVTGVATLCNGDSTGSATAVGGGGTGAYSFVWSDGQTTA